jgi:ribonuclease P/MRP protein subunit POP7
MAGIKRSINGQAKPQDQDQQPQDVAMTDATPPCGQPQPPSNKTTSSDIPGENQKNPSKPDSHKKNPTPVSAPAKQPSNPRSTNPKARQKLAKLPKSTYNYRLNYTNPL